YVPNAVVLGFMNGIAVLIWYDQICKLFGFNGKEIITGNFYTNIIVAFSTIFCIFTFPQFVKMLGVKPKYRSFLSALLLSILFMTVVASIFNLEIQKVALGATFATFQDFGNIIYKYFPTSEILTLSNVQLALPLALQLMLLGYLDSLLTALVIDRITKEKTLQNKELIAQGVSNAVSGILQGIPGAQATIRSVLLVKEQAQTRFAGVMLGVFVLISIIFFKSWIALIPSAVFAGVLFKAGWDVSDRDYMKMYFKYDWVKSINRNFQMFIILYTTIATVIFDLNVAVITGSVFFYIIIFVFKKYELKDVESEMEDNID
ncbi:MAG: SulP family inorganic anion transporter, partial [Saprospiraceae bacterium]|nr:SulP family inorganic anion transporter [Saprospiraceae bacterium]